MRNSFSNPWVEIILEQMWIVRQTSEVLVRSIDFELLLDPKALTDYCLNPSEEILNPLEFHGKRRSPTPQRLRWSNSERCARRKGEGEGTPAERKLSGT